MARRLSNKALAAHGVLRDLGELTVNGVADAVRARTPCGECQGSGEGDHPSWGCRRCYGRGQVPFHYSDAYQALMQLLRAGLVTRRHPRDEFGDELPGWIWKGEERDRALAADELEALYLAPAAGEERGRG